MEAEKKTVRQALSDFCVSIISHLAEDLKKQPLGFILLFLAVIICFLWMRTERTERVASEKKQSARIEHLEMMSEKDKQNTINILYGIVKANTIAIEQGNDLKERILIHLGNED